MKFYLAFPVKLRSIELLNLQSFNILPNNQFFEIANYSMLFFIRGQIFEHSLKGNDLIISLGVFR